MAKADDLFWRAQKQAKIEELEKRYENPDGTVDSTSGTPFHQDYQAFLQEHSPGVNWAAEASRDLDRHYDITAPKVSPDQPRLPQIEADLRIDIERRLTVKEGRARRSHWFARRAMQIEVRKRMLLPIDKEIAYATAMVAEFLTDEETTAEVLKRIEQRRRDDDIDKAAD